MPNPYFSFKQFTVYHDQCAMKVGTDGCLLGGWASHPNPKRILDVGAGSGLISLMLAQRYGNTVIKAVEIEKSCAQQCKINFEQSPFAERLSIYHTALQSFDAQERFDLIASNPPFFTKSYKPVIDSRAKARHDDSLSPNVLFDTSRKLLAPHGIISIIIPVERLEDFVTAAADAKLFPNKLCQVKPNPYKDVKRVLISFMAEQESCIQQEFYIEKSRGAYSDTFINLLGDFYLNL